MPKNNTYKISKSLKEVWQWKQAVARRTAKMDSRAVLDYFNKDKKSKKV